MGRKQHNVFLRCSSRSGAEKTRKACQPGCIGCGKCEKMRIFGAIHVENNLAVIDFDKCKNCGKFEKECPAHAIHRRLP